MTYEEFKEAVVEYAMKTTSGQATVEIQSLVKNNGVVLDGLIIREGGINISPTIYLNNYYECLCREVMSLEEVLSSIMDCYNDNKLQQDFDVSFMTDFESAKNQLVFKLVNREKNQDLLSRVPHVDYMDLAILFYYYLQELPITDGQATILITNKQMEGWNVGIEDLMEAAIANTPRLLGLSVESIVDTLKSIKPDFNDTSVLEEDGLCSCVYVVSNAKKTNGASVICYKDSLLDLAGRLESDLFIIPSSIHEVLVIPNKAMPEDCVASLRETIAIVNGSELEEQDILSDNLYFYSREENMLKIC